MRNPRIIVPSRAVNGGFDFKFETDPYNVKLYDILAPEEYTDAIQRLNDELKPSRSTKVDTVLLGTGMLILPLAVWGVRHNGQTRKRKRLLKRAIESFNAANPTLLMRWNRRPDSVLSIERRPPATAVQVETLPEVTAEPMQVVESAAAARQPTSQVHGVV